MTSTRTASRLLLSSIFLLGLFVAASASAQSNKMSFQGFFFPGTVVTNSTRMMTLCLVNEGEAGYLLPGADDFNLEIPIGTADTDFAEVASVGCSTNSPKWICSTSSPSPDLAVVRLEPSLDPTPIGVSESVCFQITDTQVNAAPGLTISRVTQSITSTNKPTGFLNPSLPIFKTEEGLIRHDDLVEVLPDQHHEKTTSFSELTDQATDVQIPDDITVNYASTAGNADTVDGLEGPDLVTKAELGSSLQHIRIPAGIFMLSGPNSNTAIGVSALSSPDLLGNRNSTAVGFQALQFSTEANTGVGAYALWSNTTGHDNTAVGIGALQHNTIGMWNTAIGLGALDSNIGTSGNTAVGWHALKKNEASGNTAMGFDALQGNTSGSNNVAVGASALVFNTTGQLNTAVGASALHDNSNGQRNTALGYRSLFANQGTGNTAVGAEALKQNDKPNGVDNTAVGDRALEVNSGGWGNTAVGSLTLAQNTTGPANTAVGRNAMFSNESGSSNTALGFSALYSNKTGVGNTAVGNGVLFRNTGFDNVGLGNNALWNNTSERNTALGARSLHYSTTGRNNIAIGYEAGLNIVEGSDNIHIGNAGEASDDSTIRIGTESTHRQTFVAGVANTSPAGAARNVVIDERGQLGVGAVSHSELSDVQPDQHHAKTVSFAELVDRASPAQVPVAQSATTAVTATNADTLDGIDSTLFALKSDLDAFNPSRPAPPCFDHTNRYVDCGNGTVTDTVTGIVWLKEANCLGDGLWWDAASNFAAQLADGQCGLSDGSNPGDWRLPTKEEWSATVHAARSILQCSGPALTDRAGTACYANDPAFSGVVSNVYWSSSADEVFPNGAWSVSLSTGNVNFGNFSKSNDMLAWPVRSVAPPLVQFSDQANPNPD